jgi:hypothetical protein
VVEVLKTACGDGRLTLDEFSERVGSAYQAVSLRDLPPVLADLPHPFGSDLAGLLGGQIGRPAEAMPSLAPDTEGGGDFGRRPARSPSWAAAVSIFATPRSRGLEWSSTPLR